MCDTLVLYVTEIPVSNNGRAIGSTMIVTTTNSTIKAVAAAVSTLANTAVLGNAGAPAASETSSSPTAINTGVTMLSRTLKPILRMTREYQLISLADLFAFRYRSQLAGILVTLFMLVGTLPYIALQIRAVTASIRVLIATTEGSLRTMPLSRTQTRVEQVPRSIPISILNQPRIESSITSDSFRN